ncbi:hypothetical protein BJ170DRAFT_686598 [Xylariales sp. AK1849]|nr:hypothetical protein BJ170DRAFT_686598 [Xylariales sp. AK1849]
MSRYFPHPAYAEDQPLAKTILTVHVLTRAITTGSIIGASIFSTQHLIRRLRKQPAPLPLPKLFMRTTGMSTLWTIGIVSIAFGGRMWGREEIEWQDRSWRLIESKGQVEVDDWTYVGMAAGLAASASKTARPRGWIGVVGAAGTGSVAGFLGYMGWRYGVHRGRFPGDVVKDEVKLLS